MDWKLKKYLVLNSVQKFLLMAFPFSLADLGWVFLFIFGLVWFCCFWVFVLFWVFFGGRGIGERGNKGCLVWVFKAGEKVNSSL